MAQSNAPIASLPNEILYEICNHLEAHTDLLQLSTTCHFFRQELSPLVFRTIRLTTDAYNAKSIQVVSESPLRHLVHRLEYEGKLARDPEADEKALGWVGYDESMSNPEPDDDDLAAGEARILELSDDSAFPPAARVVLGDLARFPRLATLSISFRAVENEEDFFFPLVCNYYADIGLIPDVDDWPCTLRSPRRWQRVVARSYHAIAANGALPSLTGLELPDCLPISVPEAWKSDGWREILSQLRRFHWSTKRWERSGWYEFCHGNSWECLEQQLEKYFLSHLLKVEELHLEGNQSSPLNLVPEDEEALELDEDSMPCLRKLKLYTTLIGANLNRFLAARSETLEHLTLIDCFCIKEVDDSRWRKMFNALNEAGMPSLMEFVVQDSLLYQWFHFCPESTEDSRDGARDIEAFRYQGKAFPYARWYDHDFNIDDDDDKIESQMHKGLDLKAFGAVIKLVESNNKRHRES